MLFRALLWYHIQHNDEEKDSVPHSQPHYPMRSHLLPHCPRFLPALRQRGEDYFVYFNSTLAHCVLLASGRNYSTNFFGGATHRQVPALHNDTGDTLHHCHCHSSQCSLPVAINTHNVALGQESFSQHSTQTTFDEKTSRGQGIMNWFRRKSAGEISEFWESICIQSKNKPLIRCS